MARQTAPVVNAEAVGLRAPRDKLSLDYRCSAVRRPNSSFFQPDCMNENFRNLILRWFLEKAQDVAKRRRRNDKQRVEPRCIDLGNAVRYAPRDRDSLCREGSGERLEIRTSGRTCRDIDSRVASVHARGHGRHALVVEQLVDGCAALGGEVIPLPTVAVDTIGESIAAAHERAIDTLYSASR